eukprot:634020-Alexandrium_andersonii.AAC.2
MSFGNGGAWATTIAQSLGFKAPASQSSRIASPSRSCIKQGFEGLERRSPTQTGLRLPTC